MNEQIQQMIYNLNEKVGVHWTNEDKLKFAELIVRECLNELCEQMDKHNVDLSNLPSWYKALAKTEEHFGVEQ